MPLGMDVMVASKQRIARAMHCDLLCRTPRYVRQSAWACQRARTFHIALRVCPDADAGAEAVPLERYAGDVVLPRRGQLGQADEGGILVLARCVAGREVWPREAQQQVVDPDLLGCDEEEVGVGDQHTLPSTQRHCQLPRLQWRRQRGGTVALHAWTRCGPGTPDAEAAAQATRVP